jgi:nitrogen fixation protein NifB
MLLCVASNGLNVAPYAEQLADLQLSHATLTINAVEPAVGAKIYAWVRDGKRMHRSTAGAALLWTRQQEALRALKRCGVMVKVNAILVPGVNDEHVAAVADTVARLGADVINCVPFYPVEGTEFADVEPPSGELLAKVRARAAEHLPMMSHCTRCRADAVGLLGEPVPQHAADALRQAAALPILAKENRPYVAVATLEGVLVNQHLGEAARLSVFAQDGCGFRLVETRPAPPPGGGPDRWLALARSLGDCRALLVASAGQAPRGVLAEQGIRVVMMEGLIEEGLDAAFRGAEIRAPLRREHRCGSGCAGSGTGCD